MKMLPAMPEPETLPLIKRVWDPYATREQRIDALFELLPLEDPWAGHTLASALEEPELRSAAVDALEARLAQREHDPETIESLTHLVHYADIETVRAVLFLIKRIPPRHLQPHTQRLARYLAYRFCLAEPNPTFKYELGETLLKTLRPLDPAETQTALHYIRVAFDQDQLDACTRIIAGHFIHLL